jgi:cyclic beta-1,2-glucan synthetase
MIDNLRRSLSAPAAFLGLLCAALWKAPFSLIWMAFIVGTIAKPPLLPVLVGVLSPFRKSPWRIRFLAMQEDLKLALIQIALALIFLARQARVMLDAILRTLIRLLISHRRLLQWVSAAQTQCALDGKFRGFLSRPGITPLSAAGLAAVTWGLGAPAPWASLIPLTLLWLLAPWVSARLSLPADREDARPLSPEDRRYFRRIARKTWRYFETFVTAENHFLPPDNFQEVPRPVAANRTSPTNIGLYLLSVASARDFGWIGLSDMVDRLEATMTTVKELKRYRGHPFNWYDTKDLRPLDPPYVSTVDNGNLAGHSPSRLCRAATSSPASRTFSI